MFQTFHPLDDTDAGTARANQLRALFDGLGIDAAIVPRADEHQGEYVPASAERLRWLTGFTGSAGSAVVTRTSAALFVDGRYTLQARAQVATDLFEIQQLPDAKVADWLCAKLAIGSTVGFDPRLHTIAEVERLTPTLAARGIKLKALARNPIDRLWGKGRPRPPAGIVQPHPPQYAGKPAQEKIAELQAILKREAAHAVVLTAPDSIAWLLNIRGSDIPHTPVVLAFAIIPAEGTPELFVAANRVGPEAERHLAPLATVETPDKLAARLDILKATGHKIRLDPETASWWFLRRLGAKHVVRGTDPCVGPKARKNAVEISGSRSAHVRDGIAVSRFLAWLDRQAPSGTLDEISAAQELEHLRAETQALKEISFDTISGSGPNGAIVHYRVTTTTNRVLAPGELFLVDSGAQYMDGTTDITRTIAIGEPSPEMCERFTLVLKGHIAIATARFPRGTRGIDLDPLARRALWERGLDYDHGTGHGVGSYLSVHEGPASISRRGLAALEPGMIVSNEPGYYKTGAYGIRIENLVLVTEPDIPAGGDRPMMAFETLTLAPIDRRLILPALLTDSERQWLDAYHARVVETIGPHLAGNDRAWLEAATKPL